nr:AraC family transcriptional regulator [uncultured Acidocella sp.]
MAQSDERHAGAGEETAIEPIRARIATAIKHHLNGRGDVQTHIAGLSIHGCAEPKEPSSYFYEPSFAFIARGAKRVVLGDETYVYDETHFLLTALNLPTIVQVIGASPETPYLSLKQNIDLELARSLIAEMDAYAIPASSSGAAMAIGPVTAPLAAACLRLIDLLATPQDVPILGKAIQREILYRVLTSPAGARLRQAVEIGTQTYRVTSAIQWIRENYDRALRIEELARLAGMGESTLHHHFRSLTAMSPLQYQKRIRLHEARRLMLTDRLDAGVAARRVGYDSTTQFNREYRRMFGAPPKRDVRELLNAPAHHIIAAS